MTVTGLPIWCANAAVEDSDNDEEGSLTSLDYVGMGLFLLGFSVEVVADLQKEIFKRKKTKLWIDEGLWHLAQHPNYFGEIVLWTGISISSLAGSKSFLGSVLPCLTPIFATYLLTRVSGVPFLRRANKKKWGLNAEYRKYLRETPLLIPWPK